MSKIFKSLITTAGREKIADAIVSGDKVVFSQMSVGDGGGGTTTPSENQTSLVNEIFRTQLNSLKLSDTDSVIIAEMIIPPEVGGFTIREAALFDETGECMAVANVPETYKPALAEGAGRFTILRIWLAVSSTEAIELIVDPGIVLATIEDVINVRNDAKDYTDNQLSEHARSRNHPDATLTEKGFTKLSNAIDSSSQKESATPLAVKLAVEEAIRSAWELDNPIGTVKFYAQNINPNERYPWTEWKYTGEQKTIRVGNANGSDIGTNGGSDTIKIEQRNLPAVQLDVSGETSEKGAQVIETTSGGRHHHGTFGEAPGVGIWPFGFYDETPQYLGSNDSDGDNGLLNSTEDGEHNHQATVPAHRHTVYGKTANLGQGQDLSVVESHILLMCWARVA